MIKRFSKVIVVTLIASIVTTMLAGCRKEEIKSTEQTSQAATSTEQTTQAPVPQKYDISWAVWQQGPVDENAEMIKLWNEKFNVNIIPANIDKQKWDEILNLKISSGEQFDLIRCASFSSFTKFVEQDVIGEIPLELIQKHAPELYKDYTEIDPKMFDYGKYNGKLYGINVLVYHNKFRQPIVYRGDWLKKVGEEKAPETLADFERVMYKFTNDDPDGNGKNDTHGLSYSGLNTVFGAFGYLPGGWLDSSDGAWAKKDGKLVYGAIQPEMKEALKLLNKWYKDGVLDREFITGEFQGAKARTDTFINGRIGYTSQGQYLHWKPIFYEGDFSGLNMGEVTKKDPEAAKSLVFGVPPKGPEGKSGVAQGHMIGGEMYTFGSHLENEPDKMARILEIINYTGFSDYDTWLTVRQGPKGELWDYDSAGRVAWLEGKELSPDEQAKRGMHSIMTPLFKLEFNDLWRKEWQPWLKEAKFEEGGIKSEVVTPLPSAGKYSAELNKIRDDAYIKIITGSEPIDHFDQFVEKWKKAGGEQLEKEANEWYAAIGK